MHNLAKHSNGLIRHCGIVSAVPSLYIAYRHFALPLCHKYALLFHVTVL